MLTSIFTGNITAIKVLIMLGVAIALGVLNAIIFSYKSFQTRSFSLTLALVPLISSVIIFIVNDHLGVGVAVAGAFTLVRFRSIAGNGREIIAIFASMAIGLLLGMGYIYLSLTFFAVLAILTLFLTAIRFGEQETARVLRITIPEDLDYEGIFDKVLKKYTNNYRLERIRTRNMGTLYELTYNVSMKSMKHSKAFLDDIRILNGNLNVTLSTYSDHESL